MKRYESTYMAQFKFGLVVIAVAVIVAGLYSCFKKRELDFSQVNYQMRKSEVLALLGDPDKIVKMPSGDILIYDTVQIVFIDTIVFAVTSRLDDQALNEMKTKLERESKAYADSLDREAKARKAHMDSLRSDIK